MQKFKIKLQSLLLCSFLLFAIIVQASAQQQTVTGTVSDENGGPIVGATIRIKDATIGTVSDADGKFSIKMPNKGDVLIISFIGYKTEELVPQGSKVDIVLEEAISSLEDVVVIGYGSARRADLTGSVASVSSKELEDVPVASAMEVIQGRLAGVNVTVTEGSPDADIKIRVRGGGSITQDNSPLYIVDGFQVSDIGDIPPGDIENVVVLKDASSTAIYGSQGANGVILITTKSGKAGKTEVSFNFYNGFKKVYNLTDVLSPYEYVYYQREIDNSPSPSASFFSMYGQWDDIDIYKSKEGIDWQNQLYGNWGMQQSYNVAISGGEKSIKYNLSYTRDQEDYIRINSDYLRDNLSLKLNKDFGPNLSMDFKAKLSNRVINGPSVSSGKMLRDAVKYAPVYSLTYLTEADLGDNEDSSSAEALSSLNDPIYNTQNEYKEQVDFENSYNVGLRWNILSNLTYNVRGTYAFIRKDTDNIWLKKTGKASSNGGQPVAQRTNKIGTRWQIQNTLTYDLDIMDIHKIKLLAGQEIYNTQTSSTLISSKFYPSDFTAEDVLAMWNYGTAQPTYTTIGEPTRTSSFFGRLNYTFNDRYILTVTARADGKNVFSPGNRWGFFPGAALAWRVSDEKFMEWSSAWLDDAKVRLSRGAVGNARVSSYWRQQYSFQSSDNSLYYPGESVESALVTSSVLKNEDLTWETKISNNIGLDLTMFNQRLMLTIDAYKDYTKNLILKVDLPSSSGYASQYQNLGMTSNTGLEISANAYIVEQKDFSLSANFNISFNRNIIEELDGSEYMSASSGWGVLLGSDDYMAAVGSPVGEMYGYVTDGMYTFDDFTFDETQKKWILNEGVADCATDLITTSGKWFGPGHMKLKKLSGEGTNVNADEDRKVIGHAQPKHTGGFSINSKYKNFDLSAMFNWSYGNNIYNANKIDYTTYSGSKKYNNVSSIMNLADRFSTIDPETGYNIMYGDYADPERLQEINQGKTIWNPLLNSTIVTDWAIEDGSFLRLSNLTLGYTIPRSLTQRMKISNVRFYATAYNLFCWTNYSGQDPEVDTRRSTPLTPGVDYSAYPKAHTYLFGVNVTF